MVGLSGIRLGEIMSASNIQGQKENAIIFSVRNLLTPIGPRSVRFHLGLGPLQISSSPLRSHTMS